MPSYALLVCTFSNNQSWTSNSNKKDLPCRGANPNLSAEDAGNRTALHFAAYDAHVEAYIGTRDGIIMLHFLQY